MDFHKKDVFLKTIIAGEMILADKAGNEKKVDFKKVMEQEEKKGDEPLVRQIVCGNVWTVFAYSYTIYVDWNVIITRK
ncbi:MAG: hypothetical protein ABH952_05105 [Candidatus Omnitrophota bacterium]